MWSWPQDGQTNVLFVLRWAHLLAGTAWLGLVLFFDRVWKASQAASDPEAAARARRLLEPRVLFWYRAAALGTVATGFADYVLVLSAEGLAPRALVWLAAWTLAAAVVLALLFRSASGRAPRTGPALAASVGLWLAVVAASGDWYMRRGGSHKAIALSLGGGLALIMAANAWVVIAPLCRRIRQASPAGKPEWERQVLLASRMNFWLSPAVLFFMGAASHLPFFATAPL